MTRLFQSCVDCITGQIPAYERELAELAAAMRGHREHDPVRQYQQTVFDAVIHEIAEEARELSDECQKYYIARERHLRLRLAEAQQTHKAARKERRRELQAVSHQPDCQPDSEDALSRARMEAEWRAAQERRTAENAMRDAEQKRALAEAAEARRRARTAEAGRAATVPVEIEGEGGMSGQCNGGPGTWTVYVVTLPARLYGRKPKPFVEHHFTREDALAAQATWKQRLAGNPETFVCVARWQPGKEFRTRLHRRNR